MNISLKQLNVFSSITQHNTLTAAAEALYLSKAAVSMALAELEKQLGHPLFDRVNNRLILNQEGHKLLPLADELLSRANNISQLFDADHAFSGQLKIGASDTVGNHVVPGLLSQFRQQSQHYSQSVVISNSRLICQKLLDYELDIGLIEGKSHHPELVAHQFSHDQMCIIAAPHLAISQQTPCTFTNLEHSEWVLREAGSGSREFFLRTIAPHIEAWHEVFELNTTEALINSVAAGLGLGCLSTLAAQYAINDGRVTQLQLPHNNNTLNWQRPFWLVVHKDKYHSPLLKSFIAFCHQWDNT
ncbi:LysR substrate-binding domain-containing protein [Shewanella saliphila]|uniref:LysR family transcriptional regulator n=1 Tax=Shewanella saliphila TaxID=2282698 RepID=A0ABQ2Q7W8_9GAMM|nr:LysR substrate-binding domain-containing protein [Shewanella saliphila]MCL1102148.1 LysR substrate-binding domain-containing protein [Shewanella saliphila]GGP54199.1 LysR family transcriptional regulator [Shewanella saliphila]